jgi:hypothetical protein
MEEFVHIMARTSRYFKEIERLLNIGYEPKHIMKITGIPKATVYRIVGKLQKEARHDFKNLMSNDYLWKYQMNLENYSKTIQECNEEIDYMKKKYNSIEYLTMEALENCDDSKVVAKATLLSNLTAIQSARTNEITKLVAQRDKASDMKAKIYNQGPVVHAIDEWVSQTTPRMGELPRIAELKELDKVDDIVNNKLNDKLGSEPPKLNIPEPILSEEDLEVLKEMEEDE